MKSGGPLSAIVLIVVLAMSFASGTPPCLAAGETAGANAGAAPDQGTADEPYPDLQSFFALYQPYVANISAYRPMYFLIGTDPEKSSFQISLKYRFLNAEGSLSKRWPWLQGLHFGYTQTSLWDLASDSIPFEDTSYKPELFFLTPNLGMRPSWMQAFLVQTGFQHESNGQGADLSRSTNYLYARPICILYDPDSRLGMQFSLKAWTYVNNEEETNPDLADYRGYFEAETKVGKADSLVLAGVLRWSKQGPSVQVDLTYPIHRLLYRNLDFYLHAQYVNTLAESLLHYRERTQALRLGFAIVR